MVLVRPDSEVTSPPLDILDWYDPSSLRLTEIGSLFDTTIRLRLLLLLLFLLPSSVPSGMVRRAEGKFVVVISQQVIYFVQKGSFYLSSFESLTSFVCLLKNVRTGEKFHANPFRDYRTSQIDVSQARNEGQ